MREHTWHNCDDNKCETCLSGKLACDSCWGVEGALTTDCPSARIHPNLFDAVHQQFVDFIDGVWCADNQYKVRSIMFDNMACLGYKDEIKWN